MGKHQPSLPKRGYNAKLFEDNQKCYHNKVQNKKKAQVTELEM